MIRHQKVNKGYTGHSIVLCVTLVDFLVSYHAVPCVTLVDFLVSYHAVPCVTLVDFLVSYHAVKVNKGYTEHSMI
jgi:hypothetical protein